MKQPAQQADASADQPRNARTSTREDEIRQVIEEYANDQREILRKLRKFFN